MTHRWEWEREGQNRKRKQNCFGKILATLPSRNLGSNRCILPYVARSPLIASPAYFRRAAVVRRSRCGKQTDKDDDGRSLRAWRRFFRDKGMTIGNVQQPLALSPDANTQFTTQSRVLISGGCAAVYLMQIFRFKSVHKLHENQRRGPSSRPLGDIQEYLLVDFSCVCGCSACPRALTQDVSRTNAHVPYAIHHCFSRTTSSGRLKDGEARGTPYFHNVNPECSARAHTHTHAIRKTASSLSR